MSDHLTQCPHCQTSFRVTDGQLAAAAGLVRCGSCLGLFSAALNFIRVKPGHDSEEDDILLGDLDLDATVADDDGDILFADPGGRERQPAESYELYEEYAEPPDLFTRLDAAAAATPADDPAAAEPAVADGSDAVADSDNPDLDATTGEDAAPEDADEDDDWYAGPSEEFQPRTILFDDDDDEVDEEEQAAAAADAHASAGFAPVLTDARPIGTSRPAATRAATGMVTEGSIEDEAWLVQEPSADESGDSASAWSAAAVDTSAGHDGPALGELSLDDLLDDEPEDDLDEEPEDELEDELEDPAHDDVEDDGSDPEEEAEFDDDDPGADADDFLEEYMEEILVEPREPEQPVQTGAMRREGDKAELRRYLASLEDEDELEPLGPDHLDELDEEPVYLAGETRGRSLLASTGLYLLCLLLCGGLALQFVDRHLEALRQRSAFAPLEPWFCLVLDCPAAPAPATASASSSLYSQELLVRTHPRLAGALELSFVFRNDSDTPQPFPGLELSFRDTANRLLANRLLLPTDYLPPELRPLAAMPAQSSVQVNLELVDPGADAVNYTIAFRDL